MNPMVVLFAVFATACAAPVAEPEAQFLAGALPAGGLLGRGWGLPAVGAIAAAPLAAAPLAAAPLALPAPAISVPAPYSTSHVAGPDAVTINEPPPVVTKQVHYADRPYVAAYDTVVLKPVIPELNIAVPTALKGSVAHNAPITRVSKEPFIVNEPVPVEKPYNVPYDVIKNVVRTVEVPTPVHVDAPYNVPVPTPVQGEPIIQRVQGPPQIVRSHQVVRAQPIHHGAVVGHGLLGAAPYAHPLHAAHAIAAQ